MTLHHAANQEDAEALIAGYQRRIQKTIFRISEKVPTSERAILDRYIRHVAPALCDNGETQLPTSLRRMRYNLDRTATLHYPGILYFHVGNAVVTFYDLCNNREDALTDLERRVKLIERIAESGPAKFVVIGSDGNGYTMLHKDDKATPFLASGTIQPDPNGAD